MTFNNTHAKQFLGFLTVILYLKVVLTLSKKSVGERRPPEDKVLSGNDDELQPLTSSDDDDVESQLTRHQHDEVPRKKRYTKKERWRSIAMNDLENIPLGLIILWVNPLCDSNAVVTTICALMFVISRILHTVFYAYSLQPYRSIAYTIAVLSIFVAAINIIIGALST